MIRSSKSGLSSLIETPHSRRNALGFAGKAAAGAMFATAFGSSLAMADASGGVDIGMRCLTGLYPGGEDVKFDTDYYRDHHMKTIMKYYGKSIQRFEARSCRCSAWRAGAGLRCRRQHLDRRLKGVRGS